MSAISNFSYVTLVPQGGVPVRLADQFGANLPTTGNGSLVFSNGAVLTNVTINGTVNTFPLGAPNGSVAAPSIYFGSPDKGLFSRGVSDISIAANGGIMASVTANASSFYFVTNGLQLSLFSDTTGEVVVQGYDTAAANTKKLTLNKYGSNVGLGAGVAPVAGGATTFGELLLTSAGVSLSTGTGAPTLVAPRGSLYMRNDATPMPYFNTDGATTWQQLVGLTATQTLTNKTLTSPTITGATISGGSITGATISGGSITFGAINGTSASANALSTGLTGTTNTTFNVDNSTALAVSGINIKGAVTGGTVAITATDPNAAVNLSIDAKGSGTITIGGTSTGLTTFGHAVTISGAATLSSTLTYGGVTLTAAVTGTTAMVLAASPTFTGTPAAPTAAANTNTTQIATTAFLQAALVALKINVQVITSSGTYTPTANMIYCVIECWGAGGGGGGAAVPGTAGVTGGAGGGGAGGYSSKFALAATIGASQVATIGAAGLAGTAGNNAGGSGGDTSIGALCVGKGGSGGVGSGGSLNVLVSGGAGGVAGTGDVRGVGMNGGVSLALAAVTPSGWGGSSSVGSGGSAISNAGTHVAGNAATGFASGGGGGYTANGDATASAGGVATAGYIVITEYLAH